MFELEIEKRKTQINRKPTRPKLPNPSPTRFLLGPTHSLPARPNPHRTPRPRFLSVGPGSSASLRTPACPAHGSVSGSAQLATSALPRAHSPAHRPSLPPPTAWRVDPDRPLAHLAAAVSRSPARVAAQPRPATSLAA